MELIIKIALFAPPILLAITLHEVAHGWAARYLGDPTAASLGRLSLNPIKHIDPVGTVLVPAILFVAGGFLFGWAKPVPVNMQRLNDPKRDMALVAAAGPASNFVMAFIWAFAIKLGFMMESDLMRMILVEMGKVGLFINLILMVLNLIPIPPLDGGRVLSGVLPDKLSMMLAKIEPFGMFIIFGLLAIGALSHFLQGPLSFFQTFITKTVGL
ncbi:MAG: site-2 protease family protein [Gammaproteobacteria bacterium]